MSECLCGTFPFLWMKEECHYPWYKVSISRAVCSVRPGTLKMIIMSFLPQGHLITIEKMWIHKWRFSAGMIKLISLLWSHICNMLLFVLYIYIFLYLYRYTCTCIFFYCQFLSKSFRHNVYTLWHYNKVE